MFIDSKILFLCKYSDYVFICRSDMVLFVDLLVVLLSVINVLIVVIGFRKKEEVVKIFEKFEEIWDEF